MPLPQSNAATKRFIAVEYEGRQVAVRRSAEYDSMLTLVKEAFNSLFFEDPERLSISGYVEELGANLEISRNIWPDLVPELMRITITLDNSSSESEDSDYVGSEMEDDIQEEGEMENDSSECDDSDDDVMFEEAFNPVPEPPLPAPNQNHEPEPVTHRRVVKPRQSNALALVPVPKSLPDQNREPTKGEYNIKAFYFHRDRTNWTSRSIVANSVTTIPDLLEYITLLCPFRGFILSYQLFGKPFDHLKYVRQMERSWGPKYIQVHMVDKDPGPCGKAKRGLACEICEEREISVETQ